ncbi:MAG TPA: hypothetical protein VKZ53_32305 [Candidatus Angelobacter sp.]|nr:hypothetical protein [Candidatus Angelobacter sp.]
MSNVLRLQTLTGKTAIYDSALVLDSTWSQICPQTNQTPSTFQME